MIRHFHDRNFYNIPGALVFGVYPLIIGHIIDFMLVRLFALLLQSSSVPRSLRAKKVTSPILGQRCILIWDAPSFVLNKLDLAVRIGVEPST